MRMLPTKDFLADFGNAGRLVMNMSIYRDSYKCACGEKHWLDGGSDIICQGFFKVMVACPHNPDYVTNIKIKTVFGFSFKGLESLSGTHASEDDEKVMISVVRRMAQ